MLLLKELHLPMFREYYAQLANQALRQDMSYSRYLYELTLKECEVRRANKIERLIKASKLPLEKTLGTFDLKRLPLKLRQQVKILLEGDFVDRQENILAFGKPGSGKTHLATALAAERQMALMDDITSVEQLPTGDMIITDVNFCDDTILQRAKTILEQHYGDCHIEVIYFENNPEACRRNVEYRRDGRSVEGTILRFAPIYRPPADAREIWQP